MRLGFLDKAVSAGALEKGARVQRGYDAPGAAQHPLHVRRLLGRRH